jgi:hypothetical protein
VGRDTSRFSDREADQGKRARSATRRGERYSGPSAERRSSVPGYDRERDQTVTTNAALNIVFGVIVGGGIGFAIGGEMDYRGLTALAGAIIGVLAALVIVRFVGSRPMGS